MNNADVVPGPLPQVPARATTGDGNTGRASTDAVVTNPYGSDMLHPLTLSQRTTLGPTWR